MLSQQSVLITRAEALEELQLELSDAETKLATLEAELGAARESLMIAERRNNDWPNDDHAKAVAECTETVQAHILVVDGAKKIIEELRDDIKSLSE